MHEPPVGPKCNKNALKHGDFTVEAIEMRRAIGALTNQAGGLVVWYERTNERRRNPPERRRMFMRRAD